MRKQLSIKPVPGWGHGQEGVGDVVAIEVGVEVAVVGAVCILGRCCEHGRGAVEGGVKGADNVAVPGAVGGADITI
jgi:hypothetical protein